MRVLVVFTGFTYNCGASTYIEMLVKNMHSMGHYIELAALDSRRSQDLLASGVPFRPIPLDQSEKSPARFFRNFLALDRIVRDDKIQLIHAFHRWGAFVGWFVCRLHGIPLVSTDLTILTGNRRLSIWGDHVITYSKFGKQYLMDYFGVPSRKISVVYNPISQPSSAYAEIERVRTELDLKKGYKIIVSVGRLEQQKAQVDLLAAAKIVLQRHPEALFLIVGDGSLRGTLEQTIKRLNLSERVRLLGARSDTPAIMANCHVFSLSSVWEGIPLAMLDAMEVGLPVVVTGVGGIPEVLSMGGGREMWKSVPPRSPVLLAEAIVDLLDNPEKALSMGKVGQEVVRSNLTAVQMVSGTMDVYGRLLWR